MQEHPALSLDLYELTMAQSYFLHKPDSCATFDLFVRDLPDNRSFLLSCGLQDCLAYLKNLRFAKEDIAFLKKKKLFSGDFLNYLSRFRFTGDVWAIPEGEVFFANEPVLRVTAPIIEAQIVESTLLNTINLQTMIASKASRVVLAAKGRKLFDFSLRRTHGTSAAMKVARASYIAGFFGTSNLSAGRAYGIPVAGTMAHSYIMTFKSELESFLAYSRTFPDKTTLLVDTYDTKKGILNAILTGLALKKQGRKLNGIRLDSGDIASLSKLARRQLDDAGLKYVKIMASGNLDESKIEELLKRNAKIDAFGVGTNMGASVDAPSLDVIYKLSEVTGEDGKFLPTMKLSRGKVTYPGRKQVFRFFDKSGRYAKDVIGLQEERIKGRPLLIKVMRKGKPVYRLPSLGAIRSLAKRSLLKLPEGLKKPKATHKFKVEISAGLKRLRHAYVRDLGKRQQ